jgi:diadenosine tetraphosphate (Ap4A) HIT family hydrolase
MQEPSDCVFCREAGGEIVFRDEFLRIVLPDEPDLPGLVRVILHAHVREMTDLSIEDRSRTMQAVWTVESSIRELLAPHKMNVASLGNQVPHLHWHLVPRWLEDPWFPAPIWSARRSLDDAAQALVSRRSAELAARRPELRADIAERMRVGG